MSMETAFTGTQPDVSSGQGGGWADLRVTKWVGIANDLTRPELSKSTGNDRDGDDRQRCEGGDE